MGKFNFPTFNFFKNIKKIKKKTNSKTIFILFKKTIFSILIIIHLINFSINYFNFNIKLHKIKIGKYNKINKDLKIYF